MIHRVMQTAWNAVSQFMKKWPAGQRRLRGRGLMIGIQPNTATDQIVQRGLDRGLLLNIAGGDTIRVLPPLVMSLEQAGELGAGIAHILNDIGQQEDRA